MNEPTKEEIRLSKQLWDMGVIKTSYAQKSEYIKTPDIAWCLDWLRKKGYYLIDIEYIYNSLTYHLRTRDNCVDVEGTTDLECLLQAIIKITEGDK